MCTHNICLWQNKIKNVSGYSSEALGKYGSLHLLIQGNSNSENFLRIC